MTFVIYLVPDYLNIKGFTAVAIPGYHTFHLILVSTLPGVLCIGSNLGLKFGQERRL